MASPRGIPRAVDNLATTDPSRSPSKRYPTVGALMIRRCDEQDFELICAINNDGAQAYRGTIPNDRWTEPYMSREKLQHEIDEGVVFWGHEGQGKLTGVMGLQHVQD